MKELIETWNISNRVGLYLLDALEESHLQDIAATKGRSVGEQFAHLHNVRLMWLKVSAPSLMEGMEKLEKDASTDKGKLATALQHSAGAIAKMLEEAFTAGKLKNFKPHPHAFLGYIIAHEAHHRGQILLALKANGHLPDKKVQYGMWEWGVR